MRPLGHAICHAQRDATHHALHLADTRRLHQRLWGGAVSILFGSRRMSISLWFLRLTECALSQPTVQVHCKYEE